MRPRKIAIFRALQLGDMLCAVPTLRALRAFMPEAHIELIGLPWAENFVRRFDRYLDGFIAFPGHPAFPEQPHRLADMPDFLARVQAQRFDLMIQLHGSGAQSNALALLCDAAHNAGFYPPGQFCPDPERFLPWDEGEHEVLRGLRLMEHLGIPVCGTQLEFPLHEEDRAELERLEAPEPGSYACIHPGARLPSRRWLPERFAEVGDRLALAGMRIVFTGSQEEADVVREVRRAMRMPSQNLCGKTSLGALAALVAQARVVVSNDTAISHVAAALATPSVIACCGADPGRWAPLDSARHRVLEATVSCRPCMHRLCPIGHPCAHGLSAADVASAAIGMLGFEGRPQ